MLVYIVQCTRFLCIKIFVQLGVEVGNNVYNMLTYIVQCTIFCAFEMQLLRSSFKDLFYKMFTYKLLK